MNIDNFAFVIGDTETTGLYEKQACELALREICPHTLDNLWEIRSLLDPGKPIEPKAAEIHGITDEMVADEPTIDEFIEYRLGDRFVGRKVILICHNVKFDRPLLEPLFDIHATICTMELARRLMPKGTPGAPENHKLQTLREHFGIEENNAHSALDDVHITHGILREMLKMNGRTLLGMAFEGPVDIHVMPFGEHAGKPLTEVPRSYLQWMLTRDFDANLLRSVEQTLELI